MPKYYVSSGDLRIVIDRENADIASIDAFKLAINGDNPPQSFGTLTKISEAGFDSDLDDDLFSLTERIMEKAGFEVKED